MFRPILNPLDVFIFTAMVLALPYIGPWALLLAALLTLVSTIAEEEAGWEVYDNSKD